MVPLQTPLTTELRNIFQGIREEDLAFATAVDGQDLDPEILVVVKRAIQKRNSVHTVSMGKTVIQSTVGDHLQMVDTTLC